MIKTLIYPGSFAPVTKGHIDIIQRASKMTEKLVVCVMINCAKKYWFSPEERKDLIEACLGDIDNVEVVIYEGLLIDYMKKNDITNIVKGIRSVADYEYELQLAMGMKTLSDDVETIFIPASSKNAYTSSTIVRELAFNKGDISAFVCEEIKERIEERAEAILNSRK